MVCRANWTVVTASTGTRQEGLLTDRAKPTPSAAEKVATSRM